MPGAVTGRQDDTAVSGIRRSGMLLRSRKKLLAMKRSAGRQQEKLLATMLKLDRWKLDRSREKQLR
jgi:hypothetical protein